MYKGGYQIVDFTGITLSDTSTTIAGLYNKLVSCDKPLLIRGFVQNSITYLPFFAWGVKVNSTTTAIITPVLVTDESGAAQVVITVSNTDGVTTATAEITSAT